MTTHKKPAPLRDQIIAFLTKRTEANLKQIVAATTERDFPSRVTNELNKLRADAVVECAKKKGKNELWYWLATAQADQSGDTQPAVVQNTGSSASALPSTPAEGAAVQPEPAPAATVPTTAAPAAADENYSLLGVIADIRAAVGDPTGKLMLSELAEHIRARFAELDATPATLRAELKKADDELAEIQAALAGRVYIVGDLDELPSAAQCASRAAAVIDQLTSANRDHLNMIAIASETLAPLVSGDIDTSDMDLHEIAEQAAARIAAKDTELLEQATVVVALRATITQRNAELSNAQALVEKLEHLLQSARNEAEHLRRHVTHNEDGLDGQPLGNLLMGAREFLEVGQRVTVTGGEAKVEVRALNITFDLAPHEVSEVLEHATALERKLPVPF